MTHPHTIRLSFDIFQLSRSLTYEFFNPDLSVKPLETVGPFTGSYNLLEGDHVQILIVATSDIPDRNIGIEDATCTFVFVNKERSEGKSPNLSPFDHKQASFTLVGKDWMKHEEVIPLPNGVASSSSKAANITPKVYSDSGIWEMSGFLSVTYWVDDKRNTYTRLFSFDPETSAGSGGPPPGLGYYDRSA